MSSQVALDRTQEDVKRTGVSGDAVLASQESASAGCPFALVGSGPGGSNATEAEELRRLGPAPRVMLPGGVEARTVVDHALAVRIASGPEVSRDAREHWPGFRDGSRSVEGVVAAWVGTHNALNSYGEEHKRLRAPIAAALSKRRVAMMLPVIEEIVSETLDGLAGQGEVDLVSAFAQVIPQKAITRLLGVPGERLPEFVQAASGLFATSANADDVSRSMASVVALLQDLVASARTRPGDDLVSDLITAADTSGDPVTDEALIGQLMLVIIAGTETTVHAIGTLLVHLMTHPLQRSLVSSGQVPLELALEESLRLQPPVAAVPLRFVVDTFTDEASGQAFPSGEALLLHLAGIGIDPAVHDSPEQFDVQRTTARTHLAFGHGAHFCPGAPLARSEVTIAVRQWLERFPASQLAVDSGELCMIRSFISNGYDSIPTRLR